MQHLLHKGSPGVQLIIAIRENYYDISYSVKTIDPVWIAGNGKNEGLWVNNKSGFFILNPDLSHHRAYRSVHNVSLVFTNLRIIVQQGDVSLPGYFFIYQNGVQHECGLLSNYVIKPTYLSPLPCYTHSRKTKKTIKNACNDRIMNRQQKGADLMKNIEWKDKVASFKKIDVRGIAGNFLDGLKKQAAKLPVGEGMEVIQSFEPIPLYEIMEMLGYEHYTEKTAEHEYHAYFYRTEEKGNVEDAPERQAVITNYPMIDEKLGELAVEFWDMTWKSEKRYLDYNIRLLLSLANAVGAGRMRQAMRELLKAYANGLDSRALDDVFEQLAWNMGIGFFSSEIAPSPLFHAYKLIKQMEKQGKERNEINQMLREKLSDKKGGCK